MRPKIDRPCLVKIDRYFDEQLFMLKRDDPESFEKGKQLKRLMVGGYLSLIHMNDNISYFHWAGYMMLAIAKCGGLVLKMNLMRHAFDLIFSLYTVCVSCGLIAPDSKLDRYKLKYGTDKTTYKDAYDLATDFNNTWQPHSDIFNNWKTTLKEPALIGKIKTINFTKLDLNEAPHTGVREFVEGEKLIDTRNYIVSYLWKAARTNYYRLKYYNLDSWDYEVVFQSESAPFPDAIMFDLLGKYEQRCGWLPVGDVGLFSPENLSKMTLLDCIKEVDGYAQMTGTFRSVWQYVNDCSRRTKLANDEARKAEDELRRINVAKGKALTNNSVNAGARREDSESRMAGEGKVVVGDQPRGFDPVKELRKMGISDKYPPEAVEYIAKEMNAHRVLDTTIFTNINQKYTTTPLFNGYDLEPDLLRDVEETQLFGLQDFAELIKNDFNIGDCIVDGKFQRPQKSPFDKELKRMQQLKEFLFFKKMFQAETVLSGGLFMQACIDYSNRFDPNFRDTNEDDWVDWSVIDMGGNEGALVNDPKYFLPGTMKDDDGTFNLTERPGAFPVRAEGLICYGYNEYGDPLYAGAIYTEGRPNCSLSTLSYDKIKGAVQKDPITQIVRLPFLTETDVGEMIWRGEELLNLDISYWHAQLGHISLRGIKKYMRKIKGLPPYFWLFKIQCEECDLGGTGTN